MNKTSMHKLKKDLAIRLTALPTLKAKETALRSEIVKVKNQLEKVNESYILLIESQSQHSRIWMEYPSLLSIKNINIEKKNIAGVKIPKLKDIDFHIRDYSLFGNRAWVPGATVVLKNMATTNIRIQLIQKELQILNLARKKTTQKVNLYEKVQIPQFNEAIQKIKRFLEDEENLTRSAQKIIKTKKEKELLSDNNKSMSKNSRYGE
jgi:V/A-type H+-transporting ATPase subunit D